MDTAKIIQLKLKIDDKAKSSLEELLFSMPVEPRVADIKINGINITFI